MSVCVRRWVLLNIDDLKGGGGAHWKWLIRDSFIITELYISQPISHLKYPPKNVTVVLGEKIFFTMKLKVYSDISGHMGLKIYMFDC